MLTGLAYQKEYDAYMEKFAAMGPDIDANIEAYRKADVEITVCNAAGAPIPGAKVTLNQRTHAFDFGCNALMLGDLGDQEAAYEEAITGLFNLITTTMCWAVTEYEEGKYRFEEGVLDMFRRPPIDRMIAFAKKNGLRLKGQPLLADSWYPAWASRDKETLKRQAAGYFAKVADHCGGRVDILDVVNEAFLCPRRTPDFPLLDAEYSFIDWAFETVRGLFPDTVDLELNEANSVNDHQADEYFAIAKRLLGKGLPLRSLGLQFHMFNQDMVMKHLRGEYFDLDRISAAYKKYCELGIPLYISEITVPSDFPGSRQQGEETQAEIIRNLYRLWFSVPNMKGIIYWNLKDGPAWKNEGNCRGCLIDQNLQKKPSYQALYQLIKRDWMTRATLETDADGKACLRGFKGDYELKVEAANAHAEMTAAVGKAPKITVKL